MGFFQRITNLWRGMISVFVSDAENRNPEAVYESAILERKKKGQELKKAVSNIVYLRNKLATELEDKERELKEVTQQIPVAVEDDEDEVALVLIEKKSELTSAIEDLSVELSRIEAQAENAKAGLVQFQSEIKKLQREKEQMLATKTTAEARIEIQESLSGMSMEADMAALDNVRSSIQKLKAEADIGTELEGASLDAKLAKVREKSNKLAARAQLDEMKSQMAARKAASEGQGGPAGGPPKNL